MPTTYDKCGKDVQDLVKRVMEKWHLELHEAGVRVGCLFAHAEKDDNGRPKTEAVKLHGYPCAAVVRIRNLKDRTHGLPDAEIVIDGDAWTAYSDEMKEALIDHELEHLELKRTSKGYPDSDDLGRPKLKMKLHDWQHGGFSAIAHRHGEHAFEVQVLRRFAEGPDGQFIFAFAAAGNT